MLTVDTIRTLIVFQERQTVSRSEGGERERELNYCKIQINRVLWHNYTILGGGTQIMSSLLH